MYCNLSIPLLMNIFVVSQSFPRRNNAQWITSRYIILHTWGIPQIGLLGKYTLRWRLTRDQFITECWWDQYFSKEKEESWMGKTGKLICSVFSVMAWVNPTWLKSLQWLSIAYRMRKSKASTYYKELFIIWTFVYLSSHFLTTSFSCLN